MRAVVAAVVAVGSAAARFGRCPCDDVIKTEAAREEEEPAATALIRTAITAHLKQAVKASRSLQAEAADDDDATTD